MRVRVTVAEGLDGEDAEGLLDLQAELLGRVRVRVRVRVRGLGLGLGLGLGVRVSHP